MQKMKTKRDFAIFLCDAQEAMFKKQNETRLSVSSDSSLLCSRCLMFSNMKGGKLPVSLWSGNVSICHPWGPGTCQRAALQR